MMSFFRLLWRSSKMKIDWSAMSAAPAEPSESLIRGLRLCSLLIYFWLESQHEDFYLRLRTQTKTEKKRTNLL